MLGAENVWTWLVAHVQAILPGDWRGKAGELYREGLQAVSQSGANKGLLPESLGEAVLDLGGHKLAGLANREHAEAEKNYAEATKAFSDTEDKKIETELKRRSLESDLRKREAEARKAVADADLAEFQVLRAKLELFKEVGGEFDLQGKLKSADILLYRNDKGNLTFFPKPNDSASVTFPNPE